MRYSATCGTRLPVLLGYLRPLFVFVFQELCTVSILLLESLELTPQGALKSTYKWVHSAQNFI